MLLRLRDRLTSLRSGLPPDSEQNMKHAGSQKQLRMVRVGAMRGKCRHVNRESGLSDFQISLLTAAT